MSTPFYNTCTKCGHPKQWHRWAGIKCEQIDCRCDGFKSPLAASPAPEVPTPPPPAPTALTLRQQVALAVYPALIAERKDLTPGEYANDAFLLADAFLAAGGVK